MIYLSAQPFTTYFIWQLEIQLRNFKSLGIKKENIHVLFAYSKTINDDQEMDQFVHETQHLACFFFYEDLRENSKYTSSVRPHILKKHFLNNPELEQEIFFYHDSDILFSRVPQIVDVEINDICYVSDTRNYLDINYIRKCSSEKLLDDMLAVVGLDKKKLEGENHHSGGAQYVLKGITASFWDKIERDSESLFVLMKGFNVKLWEQEYPKNRIYRSRTNGIQAWCADMWAVLWNLWLLDLKVEIHTEMNFSWPYSPIEEWSKVAIQHYSGDMKDKDKYFNKVKYLNYSPWYDDELDVIPQDNCSYEIVNCIRDRRAELEKGRATCFEDTLIILEAGILNEDVLYAFHINKKYIQKYLDVAVILIVNDLEISNKTKFIYNRFSLLSDSLMLDQYAHFITYSVKQIMKIEFLLELLNHKRSEMGFKYFTKFHYQVDALFRETFMKMMEIELFDRNKGKFNQTDTQHSVNVIPVSKLRTFYNHSPSYAGIEKEFYHEIYELI